jgi:hypothetical protein
MSQEFETYLTENMIDGQAFKLSEPERWQIFKDLFEKVHPNSFTMQKKFLLNDLRRLYYLKPQKPETTTEAEQTQTIKPAKPVIKRAPIIKKPEV